MVSCWCVDVSERYVEELRQKARLYSREVSRLQREVEEAEAQAQALEEHAPPEQSEPMSLLKSIRRKADLLLGERSHVLGRMGAAGVEDVQLAGPLSDMPEEEATRWVQRRLLGQL